MDEMDDIVQEFLVESYENLDELDRSLVALEQEPGSRELLSSIFRTIHTIKGTSGFLAFNRLEKIAHAGESLLSRLRDGALAMTPQIADALLLMVDTVRAILTKIEQTGSEGDVDIEAATAAVMRCLDTGGAAAATPASPAPSGPESAVNAPEPAVNTAGEEAPDAAPPGAAEQGIKRSIADTSVRVDVDLLDALMQLVGELVLTRNQIVQHIGEIDDPQLGRTTQRLNLITSELQESVMKTRMQPIDHLFNKLPRVVRDLSSQCGKQVRVVMEGKETELDRSLLEAVKDPLTHLVRNAVDHGVESPETRRANNKNLEGTLTLRAYHEGGNVIVEVTDDGAGIDPERVAATALKRSVVTREQLSHMDEREILCLVFRPGFSTAGAVTNVSGRGVGMDVVKTNIERIGGAVVIDSTVGVGTTWRLTIPLTLAIIQALTVDSGTERYAIPQAAVLELVFVGGESSQAIEYISGAPVYRLRGKLLPLVHLDEILQLAVDKGNRGVYVAVVQAEGRRFGLVVDRVLNTEEIVVKPLTSRFKEVGAYAGATILGDGKVALILDVQALGRRAHMSAAVAERTQVADQQDARARQGNGGRLLIVGVGDRRLAIPLEMVTRLEVFPAERLERVGTREVVQYRGQILPVARLAHLLGTMPEGASDTVLMVVYTEYGRSVALAVEKIIDIVDDVLDTQSDLDDDGLTGSVVIQEKVTALLDVRRAILAADPMFYAGAASMSETSDVVVGSAR